MPTQKRITITIDGQKHQVIPGATRGSQLHTLAALADSDQLYLEIAREPDVPVAQLDLMFLRGGEVFSIGSKDAGIPDNPIRRNPISFILNDQPINLLHDQHSHSKVTGEEIKAFVASSVLDLWADLEGIPDALIADHDQIILQANEVFFTVERDHSEAQDRFYEVITVFEDEERSVSLPALMRVNEALRRILPPDMRAFAEYYMVRDRSEGDLVLPSDSTLRDAGVKDSHVLNVVKTNRELSHFFVNSKPRTFKGERISYEELVLLMDPHATFEFIYTVAYAMLNGQSGTLAPNQSVNVEEGMDFRVRKTNRS